MNGLSCGEEIMTIRSAVLIQCQCVTDGQTNGRTSSLYLLRGNTCFSIADAHKNELSQVFKLDIGNDLGISNKCYCFMSKDQGYRVTKCRTLLLKAIEFPARVMHSIKVPSL